MSLLNVPSRPRFLLFSHHLLSCLTPPAASLAPLTGIRLNTCATPLWCGSSGRLAAPIPNTRDKGEHWCEVSVCVLASVPVVTDPFSLVNGVCDVMASDSDCESVERQTFSFSRKRDATSAILSQNTGSGTSTWLETIARVSSHLRFRFSLLFRYSRESFCKSSPAFTARFRLGAPHTKVTSSRSTGSLKSAARTESVIFVHVVTNYSSWNAMQ